MMARTPLLYPRSCHILHPPLVVDLRRRIYRWHHLFDGSFTEQRLSLITLTSQRSLFPNSLPIAPPSAPLILRPPSGHQHITCSFEGPFAHPRVDISHIRELACDALSPQLAICSAISTSASAIASQRWERGGSHRR